MEFMHSKARVSLRKKILLALTFSAIVLASGCAINQENKGLINDKNQSQLYQPKKIEIFTNLNEFNLALIKNKNKLTTESIERQSKHEVVKDQDFPINAFGYNAHNLSSPGLVILGGMGPLAGIQAGEASTTILKGKFNVLLFQLTKIPDRTEGIIAGKNSKKWNSIVHILRQGIINSAKIMQSRMGNKDIDVIIICNTAHNYIQDLAKDLPGNIHIISILDAATKNLKLEKKENPNLKVAALDTYGTREQKLYSTKFNNAGINYEEPPMKLTKSSPDLEQDYLMKAIYQGVKGWNKKATLINGEKALAYLKYRPDINYILAGCTEIPEVINVVKTDSKDKALVKRLNQLVIINPVNQALVQYRNQ